MDKKRKTKKKLKLSTPEAKSHSSNLNFICNTEVEIQLERLSESLVAKKTASGSALPPGQTKKKLKLSAPKTKLHPSNPHFICDKEAVIQLERLSESVVAKRTAVGSSLPPEQTKKKLKLSTPKTKLQPSNTHFICDKEAVIQLERLSESVVAKMTAVGSSLPPEQTKKKLKLSTPKTKLQPSNPHFICDKEAVIQLERLSESVVAKMTAVGSSLPPEQTKKKLKLSAPKTKLHPSNPHFICDKEAVIQLERLSESVVAKMTAVGSSLPPEQTKKKLKLSTPKTKLQPSNPHFICDKEAVIQLERLSESVVAKMTAVGSSLPPEQTKKKLKLSAPKTKLHPSNPHFICDKEVVIQLERLSESVVAKMTMVGSSLPPEQTKKKLKLSTPKTKLQPSNPHFICDKEAVIQLERLSESVVAKMTAVGSSLPPEQTKKKLKLSAPKTKLHPSNPHFICDKEVVIQLERLSESVVMKMTTVGSSLPPEQTKKKLSTPKTKLHPSNSHFICDKEVVIQLKRLSESVVAKMTVVGSSLPPEQTKKKLSTSMSKLHPSNPYFISDKEAVIQLERLSESVVAKMTAVGSSLPPEQTKKKLKLSAPKTKLHPSNPHFICDKEVVIQLERLSESVVAKMTMVGSSLPPEQTKKKLKLSTPKTKLHPSNPHFICDKELVIQLERLSESVVAKMTAVGSSLPPEQVNETNDDALGINSLPDEIILKVFSYFTQNQLGQIARVCRRWNVLTKSPVLWRKVNVKIFSSFRQENTVAKFFINGLPSSVTFIRLDFSKCEKEDFEELCAKLHQNCPHLQDFILTNLTMSNLLPEVINFCTQFLQCVKKLVFHYCNFSKYSRIVELSYNSKIEVLDLCSCDFSHCCKTQFSKLIYLKELRLSATNVDDTWFVHDTSFLNHLHVLDLGWTEITASTFLAIQRHGHNLKELYLCYCSLKDHHLHFDNSVFPHLKTICLFYVSGFSVTCEGVVFLIQSCPSLQNVYVNRAVAESFSAHPFVVANRCKSGIVKAIDWSHNHIVNYLQN